MTKGDTFRVLTLANNTILWISRETAPWSFDTQGEGVEVTQKAQCVPFLPYPFTNPTV
jgi:hypothetical protein